MRAFTTDTNHLFLQLAQNKEAALWQLHKTFFHRIYRFVFAIVGNKESAEEVVNDCFLDLWEHRQLLTNVGQPEVYIFVCAKNRALKHLRKQQNYTRTLETIHDFPCQIELSPYDLMVSSEIQRKINAAIHSLPPQCKLIFSLVKENNLKYREVAQILGLSLKTIENQMAIALKKLSAAIPLSLIS